MVVPRRRKHQPSSSVHHRLESIELVLRNADEGGSSFYEAAFYQCNKAAVKECLVVYNQRQASRSQASQLSINHAG